jgi:hypothetical protein
MLFYFDYSTLMCMKIRTHVLIVLMSGFILCGCDNYQTGYQDGYAKKEEKHLIIFDRAGYRKGYQAGQSEVFQSDWISENTFEDDGLQCRDIIVKADPLMFLPDGYKEATTDVYQLNQ